MTDPLAEVVALLQPQAPFSKRVLASAPWAVRRTELGQPFYFAVLEGGCQLHIDSPSGGDTLLLQTGDFVLIPAAHSFATASLDRRPPRGDEVVTTPIQALPGGARVGDPTRPVDTCLLVGHCVFGSPDAALLVSLLPRWIHARGEPRLATLMQLVGDESRAERPAREIVLARLLEVMLIEALRAAGQRDAASPGLVRALADPQLAQALRRLHEAPQALDRGPAGAGGGPVPLGLLRAFQPRGGPAAHGLSAGLAHGPGQQLLRQQTLPMAEIAERVGYRSVSAFGVAFTRHVGLPPGRYARARRPPTPARDSLPR
jgi:AraC-like DNA-binding protein